MPALLTIDHVRQSAAFFAALLLVPLAIGATNAWSFVAGAILVFVGAPTFLILLVLGGAVFTLHGLREAASASGGTRIATALASPVLAAAVVAAAWPSVWLGSELGWRARFAIGRTRYEHVIAEFGKSFAAGERACRANACQIDGGPPLRLAFDAQGMLDNWSGIVFDPTGQVLMADGFDPVTGRFAAPEAITKVFGGDLVGCRRLHRQFYRCSFT